MERNKPRSVHEIIEDLVGVESKKDEGGHRPLPQVIQAGTGNVNIYAPGGLKLTELPQAAPGAR